MLKTRDFANAMKQRPKPRTTKKSSGCPGCVILEKQMSAEPRLICRYFRSTSKIIFEIFFVRTCIGSNFSQFRDFFCLPPLILIFAKFRSKIRNSRCTDFFPTLNFADRSRSTMAKRCHLLVSKENVKLDTRAGTGLDQSP